jgi:eukaryotic-like serine/threonine-protein kinase
LCAVALGGVGVGGGGRQVAEAAPHDAPAREIARLRAKAARVQAAIDRMNARVERLVEDDNEVREALARRRVEQARTREQVLDARRRLRVARRQLGKRLWTIYTGGAPSTLGQLLGADRIHQALVTTKYQEQVVGPTAPPSTGSSGCAGRSRPSPPGWPTRPSARSSSRPAWPPPDRLTVSGGRKGLFLLDFGGRDPRGPTPRTSYMSMSQVGSGLPRLLAERYELSEQVAAGGMTSVWRGHDRVLGRDVVVKVLHPELAADPSFRARFHEEAVNAARLTHPNIVALYDTGEQGDVAYIVMELVNGPTLREALGRHGPLPPSRAARLSMEVAAALDYAHQAGVCHGSLKPGNILLADDGTVKVADFSIARAASDDDPGRTGEVLGADGYLAPEVARGDDADGRADVYGLGACLYQMLTGRPPGADPSTTVPPRALRAGVPRDLDAIVRQAMATDPADRFQTVQAMAAALSRSAAGVDGPPAEFLPVPPAPTGPEVTPSRGFLRHEGRLLGWVLGLVAVAAILVTVGLTLAKDDLGNLFGADQPSGTSRATATNPPVEKVKVEDATSFDPQTDEPEKTENPELASRAIDGDLTTSWRTEGYNQNFGPSGIKDGVGLVLDLGRSQEVRKLTLTLDPPGPSALTIYGSDDDPPTLEGWKQLADKTGEGRVSFNLDGSHHFLLIWFTSLPQDDDGKFRGGVANVTLTS